jgi:hypothetical protein
MEYNEFMIMVKCGMEYNFYIDDEEYWISHNLDGYYVTRVKDSYTQEFKTSDELFENARINDKTILQLWNIIKEYC